MFNPKKIEEKADIEIAISNKMAKGIELWLKMYSNESPWLDEKTTSMGLAASVSSELARLTTLELKSSITGCDYLNDEYLAFLKNLRDYCEYACAGGGIVFKPYIEGKHIVVEAVMADDFYPISFNGRGKVTDAIFLEEKVEGDKIYTRLERHICEKNGVYRIINKAYVTNSYKNGEIYDFGKEISLDSVLEWADLEPEIEISNIDKSLFGYFKIPLANSVEKKSPLGVSAFSRAVNDIKEADKQWSRILWEFEGSELAVHASVDCFEKDDDGSWKLPKGRERLYRTMYNDAIKGKAIDIFSPSIRDTSLFNGLNNILKRIEFNCGLAYGTISDPQNVDKTAEEIKTSKQRSYQTVSDIQGALQSALEDLLYAMVKIGQIEGLPVTDKYDVSFSWDDSIIIDKEKQLASMQLDVSSGILRPEIYIAKKYGITEEEALKMMPSSLLDEE